MPDLELWHFDAAELERLRGLIAAPEVLGAASTYRRSGLKDGGYMAIVAGSRRIYFIAAPPNLPPPLAELAATYHRIFDTFEAERVDGFLARGPHLLAVHERWFRGRPFGDRLVVFGNGVLEYRVTHSDAPDLPNGDDPDPQIRLEQVPLAALTDLRDVLAAPALAKVPSHGVMNVESGPGTSHMLAHAGAVPRIRRGAARGSAAAPYRPEPAPRALRRPARRGVESPVCRRAVRAGGLWSTGPMNSVPDLRDVHPHDLPFHVTRAIATREIDGDRNLFTCPARGVRSP